MPGPNLEVLFCECGSSCCIEKAALPGSILWQREAFRQFGFRLQSLAQPPASMGWAQQAHTCGVWAQSVGALELQSPGERDGLGGREWSRVEGVGEAGRAKKRRFAAKASLLGYPAPALHHKLGLERHPATGLQTHLKVIVTPGLSCDCPPSVHPS